ncbi:hypothetical protein NIES4071_88680 [Calothrix sp. NIES-4071]|nr:hypothetical protein NIES4071_88680 [Calothrix sp. NIES-4071]BAZ63135.1 hypothetical protein NIES4105_88610 [Calothrix sp. NIES-4105]
MTSYLLDTNVLLRFCNLSDVQHSLVTDVVSFLLAQGDKCFKERVQLAPTFKLVIKHFVFLDQAKTIRHQYIDEGA